jgi:outer membrane cobalamin receptor
MGELIMKITMFSHCLKFTAIACGFFFLINPAFAQDEAVNTIEEVIVTSQRVEESLQDVPIAVTALNSRYARRSANSVRI